MDNEEKTLEPCVPNDTLIDNTRTQSVPYDNVINSRDENQPHKNSLKILKSRNITYSNEAKLEMYKPLYSYFSKEEINSLSIECHTKNLTPNTQSIISLFLDKIKNCNFDVEIDNSKLYFVIKLNDSIEPLIPILKKVFALKINRGEYLLYVLVEQQEISKSLIRCFYLRDKLNFLLSHKKYTFEEYAAIDNTFNTNYEKYRKYVDELFFIFKYNFLNHAGPSLNKSTRSPYPMISREEIQEMHHYHHHNNNNNNNERTLEQRQQKIVPSQVGSFVSSVPVESNFHIPQSQWRVGERTQGDTQRNQLHINEHENASWNPNMFFHDTTRTGIVAEKHLMKSNFRSTIPNGEYEPSNRIPYTMDQNKGIDLSRKNIPHLNFNTNNDLEEIENGSIRRRETYERRKSVEEKGKEERDKENCQTWNHDIQTEMWNTQRMLSEESEKKGKNTKESEGKGRMSGEKKREREESKKEKERLKLEQQETKRKAREEKKKIKEEIQRKIKEEKEKVKEGKKKLKEDFLKTVNEYRKQLSVSQQRYVQGMDTRENQQRMSELLTYCQNTTNSDNMEMMQWLEHNIKNDVNFDRTLYNIQNSNQAMNSLNTMQMSNATLYNTARGFSLTPASGGMTFPQSEQNVLQAGRDFQRSMSDQSHLRGNMDLSLFMREMETRGGGTATATITSMNLPMDIQRRGASMNDIVTHNTERDTYNILEEPFMNESNKTIANWNIKMAQDFYLQKKRMKKESFSSFDKISGSNNVEHRSLGDTEEPIKIPHNVIEPNLAKRLVLYKHDYQMKGEKKKTKISLFGHVKPVDIIQRGITPFPYLKNEEDLYTDVLILGGGVSGLAAAYYLNKCKVKILVIEGRNRIGGRAFSTILPQRVVNNRVLPETVVDLGANYLHCCDHMNASKKKKTKTEVNETLPDMLSSLVKTEPEQDLQEESAGGSGEEKSKMDTVESIEPKQEKKHSGRRKGSNSSTMKYMQGRRGRRKKRGKLPIESEINRLESKVMDNIKTFQDAYQKLRQKFGRLDIASNTKEKLYLIKRSNKLHESDYDYDTKKEEKKKKNDSLIHNMLCMMKNDISQIRTFYKTIYKKGSSTDDTDMKSESKSVKDVYHFLKEINENVYFENTLSDHPISYESSLNKNGKGLTRKTKSNWSKDPRKKRGFDKSITKLAEHLKPKVSLVCGKDNWESTFYANWYNNENGKKIKNFTIYKVNFLCDKIRIRAARKISEFWFIMDKEAENKKEEDIYEEEVKYNEQNGRKEEEEGDEEVGENTNSSNSSDISSVNENFVEIKKNNICENIDTNENIDLDEDECKDIISTNEQCEIKRTDSTSVKNGNSIEHVKKEGTELCDSDTSNYCNTNINGIQGKKGNRGRKRKSDLKNTITMNNLSKKKLVIDWNVADYDEGCVIYNDYYNYGEEYDKIVRDTNKVNDAKEIGKTVLYDEHKRRRSMWDLLMECTEEILNEMNMNKTNFSLVEWKMLMVMLQSRYGYGSDLRKTSITMSRIPFSNEVAVDNCSSYGNDEYVLKNMKFFDKWRKVEQVPHVHNFKDNNGADRLVVDGWKWLIDFLSEDIQSNVFVNTVAEQVQVLSNKDPDTKISDYVTLLGGDSIKNKNEETNGNQTEDKIILEEIYKTYKSYNNTKDYNVVVKCKSYEMSKNQNKSFHGLTDLKNCDHVTVNIYAKYVIVALPLGTLVQSDEEGEEGGNTTTSGLIDLGGSIHKKKTQDASLKFIPPLHPLKVKAMNHYKMGNHNKIILRFYPFDFTWPFESLQINCLDQKFQFLNLHAYGKGGCILVHCFPPWSSTYGYIKKEYFIVNECLFTLNKMFEKCGKKLPVLVDYIVTKWQDDIFSKGSYAYPSVNCNDIDLIYLRSPHPINNPKILFCGEYLSRNYFQCIDGAYDTGIRAAEDVAHIGLKVEPPFLLEKDNRLYQSQRSPCYQPDVLMFPNGKCPFTHLPIPKVDDRLLGFYLTDGSDESLTDYESSEEEREEEYAQNIPVDVLNKEYQYLSKSLQEIKKFFRKLKKSKSVKKNTKDTAKENGIDSSSRTTMLKLGRNSSSQSKKVTQPCSSDYIHSRSSTIFLGNEYSDQKKALEKELKNCRDFYVNEQIIKIGNTFFYNYNKIEAYLKRKKEIEKNVLQRELLFNSLSNINNEYCEFLIFVCRKLSSHLMEWKHLINNTSTTSLDLSNLETLLNFPMDELNNEESQSKKSNEQYENTQEPTKDIHTEEEWNEEQERKEDNEENEEKERKEDNEEKEGKDDNEEYEEKEENDNRERKESLSSRSSRKRTRRSTKVNSNEEVDIIQKKKSAIYLQNKKLIILNSFMMYVLMYVPMYKQIIENKNLMDITNYNKTKLTSAGFVYLLSVVIQFIIKKIRTSIHWTCSGVDEHVIIQLLCDYMYYVLFYKHDMLCNKCSSGGELFMCDFNNCTNVWHSYCCHTGHYTNDNNELPGFLICSNCKNATFFQQNSDTKSTDKIFQKYWRRRIYTYKIKFFLSRTRKIRKRLDALEAELSKRMK